MFYFPCFSDEEFSGCDFMIETLNMTEALKKRVAGVTYITLDKNALLELARQFYTEEQLKQIQNAPNLLKYLNSAFVSCHDYVAISTVVRGKYIVCNLQYMVTDNRIPETEHVEEAF